MSTILGDLIYATINRAALSIDHNNIRKIIELYNKKFSPIILLQDRGNKGINDRLNILFNIGTKRICENCNQECLDTLYYEYCD
jgi:hypothetical protein